MNHLLVFSPNLPKCCMQSRCEISGLWAAFSLCYRNAAVILSHLFCSLSFCQFLLPLDVCMICIFHLSPPTRQLFNIFWKWDAACPPANVRSASCLCCLKSVRTLLRFYPFHAVCLISLKSQVMQRWEGGRMGKVRHTVWFASWHAPHCCC